MTEDVLSRRREPAPDPALAPRFYDVGVASGGSGTQVCTCASGWPTRSMPYSGRRRPLAGAAPESSTVPSALTTVKVHWQVQASPVSSTVCGPRTMV